MKRLFTIIALVAAFSSNAQAQPKQDSAASQKVQTAPQQPDMFYLVGTEQDFAALRSILLQSKLSLAGQPLTTGEALQVIQWIEARQKLVPTATKPEETPPKAKKKKS